jgi:hypothetical protein
MKKSQIVSWIIVLIFAVAGVLFFALRNRPETPQIGPEGEINGAYTLEGIMRLGRPYVCTFTKSEGNNEVAGIIHTDGKSAYGEFRVITDLAEKEFSSFLLIKGNESYNWTSLQNAGYKMPVVKNTGPSASPQQQAQLIGTRDKNEYKCEPWQNPDQTIFDAPSWITFTELK